MSFVADNVNGQATMANSKPVVVASDQASFPVKAMTVDDGGTQRQALSDSTTGGLVNIDLNHHEIHEGDHFFISSYFTASSTATNDIIIETGAKYCHLVFSIDSNEYGFSLTTYEGVTANTDGTLINSFNNNRPSITAPTATYRLNPTSIVTTSATLIRSTLTGTAVTPLTRSAGSAVREDEVILKTNTKYLIRIANLGSGNNNINFKFNWYELT